MTIALDGNGALGVFEEAYRGSAEHRPGGAGSRTVGLVGFGMPVELPAAAGFSPIFISADRRRATPEADRCIDPVVSPEIRAIYQMVMDGDFDDLSLIVISRSFAKLYYYLKEAYRLGWAPKMPPLLSVDILQTQRPSVREYNHQQIAALVRRLERLNGVPFADWPIGDTIRLSNRIRRLQRELLARRWAGSLLGSEALAVIGAGYFMAPLAYEAALTVLLKRLSEQPYASKPKVVLMAAEPVSSSTFHKAVEAAGGVVVAENDGWGSRAPGEDISETAAPLEALLDKYWKDSSAPGVWPAGARERWFQDQVETGRADGVVFFIPPSDRQFGWDYPRLSRGLPSGLPHTLISVDVEDAAGYEQAVAELSAFFAGLTARRRNPHEV